MLSLPPAGGTGKKINGASLFGKDRYAQYVHEMNAHGTIEGIPLSKKERIEGFKSRDKKINFEKFVGKVLSEKSGGVSSDGVPTPSLGPKLSMAKSENFTSQPFTAPDIPEPEPETESQDTAKKEDFEGVGDKIDELIDEIKTGNKGEKKENERKRKRAEDKRRKSKEDRFESLKKFVAKPIEKVLAPIQNVFKKILDGLMTILFAKALLKLIDWFSDPDNQKKVQAITKFISQFWPAIVAGFIAISVALNPFVTWVITTGAKLVVGLVKMTGKLIAASARLAASGIGRLKKLALKNPKAALATALVVGTGALAVAGSRMEASEDPGPGITPNEVKSENNTEQAGMEQQIGFAGGGKVPKKGTDTVPAMLTPGEFVMSKGAVEKFGADTLQSLNAAGGGDNKPKEVEGVSYAQGGGFMGGVKRAVGGYADFWTGNMFDFDKRGGSFGRPASASQAKPSPIPPDAQPASNPKASLADAAETMRGLSTNVAETNWGKDGCVWAVNKVYEEAGIEPPWGKSLYVPDAEKMMIKAGYEEVTLDKRQPGDVMVNYDKGVMIGGELVPQAHIGIVLNNRRVLSNSSRRAKFAWDSEPEFYNEYYGRPGKFYRRPGSALVQKKGKDKVQLKPGSSAQKVSSTAAALSVATSQAGQPGMQVLPQVGGAAAPRLSSGGSGVPNLGSIDPNNNTLIVMKSIYNLG